MEGLQGASSSHGSEVVHVGVEGGRDRGERWSCHVRNIAATTS